MAEVICTAIVPHSTGKRTNPAILPGMAKLLPDDAPGLGVDLVDVARFMASLQRGGERMRERMFTDQEWQECQSRANPGPHLAARFAAKEAGMKCLGTGWTQGVGFADFEVISDGKTAPRMVLHGQAAQIAASMSIRTLRLSLSHTDDQAIAIALAETL